MNEGCPHTRAVLQDGIAHRLHLGAQLYVSKNGRVVADLALGESRPGEPMTTGTINLWMSSVKPVTAVAIAQLWQRGRLELDDRVSRHIPEFGIKGKEAITLRHVLTHTGGFRAIVGAQRGDDYEQTIARICESPLEPRWTPGRTAGYHASSAWFILAEVIRRLDGRRIDRYAREEIFLPLGMEDSWIGMDRTACRENGRRIGYMFDTSHGSAEDRTARGHSEEDCAAVRPDGNGRGPIRQLGRFYRMLLCRGMIPELADLHVPREHLCESEQANRKSHIISAQSVEALTARHRTGIFDQTFKRVVDFGLGFLINSPLAAIEAIPYGYGPYASPRTFGHSGNQSSCAFCDPENELVAAWVCNGMPGERRHQQRQAQINRAIYEDLGLSSD